MHHRNHLCTVCLSIVSLNSLEISRVRYPVGLWSGRLKVVPAKVVQVVLQLKTVCLSNRVHTLILQTHDSTILFSLVYDVI